MPLTCPRCKIVQPPENRQCSGCDFPLPAAKEVEAVFQFAAPDLVAEAAPAAETPIPPQAVALPPVRRPLPETVPPTVLLTEDNRPPPPRKPEPPPTESPPLWKMPVLPLLPAVSVLLSLSILLAALAGAGWIVSGAKHMAATPTLSRLAPSRPAAPASRLAAPVLPLTLVLQSAAAGRHIVMGTPVVITAFATLGPGQSAALALSCRPAHGQKTMFSFVEGRLCSANWTPPAPGRYEFTATALDDQAHAVAAPPLYLVVDGPPVAARLPESPVFVRPVIRISPSLSERRSHQFLVRARRPPEKPPLPVQPIAPVSTPSYHVVAASFPFSGNAEILARALRARGLPAVTSRRRAKHGKTAYVVEIGTFRQPAEAHQKMLALQRSGYPAYTQRQR